MIPSDELDPITQPLEDETMSLDQGLTPIDPDVVTNSEEEPSSLGEDELEDLFLTLLLTFDRHDEFTRDFQVRVAARNDLFVKGIQNVYFSELAHDYRTIPDISEFDDYDDDLDSKIVNILKPYRESIVAALTVGVPTTRFYPEDADNSDDLFAARTYSKAADLIRRKNNARFLFIKALSTDWTQGFVAGYNYSETDKKHGVTKRPKIEQVPYSQNTAYCPDCGSQIGQSETPTPPDPSGVGLLPCPDCATEVAPEIESEQLTRDEQTGTEEIPKTKECIKIYSLKFVQVAPWAREIDHTPYLILNEEFHVNWLKAKYPDYAEDITPTGDRELYDRWARLSYNHGDDQQSDLATRRMIWIHPWAFLDLDEEDAVMLAQLYPDGVRVTFIGDKMVEIKEERMEDHWTLALDPTEDFVHAEPPINAVIPIQEMTTDQRVLTLETMRYSISETFVDSAIIDWKKYKEQEIRPGTIVPVKAPVGGNLQNSFFSTKSATLSQEVALFGRQLLEDGQFVTGAYPTIYGGSLEGGSGTAAEYSMSRAQAMQRLQVVYQKMATFWSELEGKATKDFLNNLKEDTKFVVPQGKTGFINIWIRVTQLTGEIGLIEPENSEQFPISWAQKRDTLFKLMDMNNEFLNAALFHPENRGFCAEVIGLPELYIPGDEDRIKQLHEILELIQQAPLDAQGIMPSIPIDEDIDDDEVHIEVTKAWLVSPPGQYSKQDNPAGYMNIVAHLKMHLAKVAQDEADAMMQATEPPAGEIPPP